MNNVVLVTGGAKVPRADAPRGAGDPPALVAVADKARRVLGRRPELADLESIVKTAWDWHVRHHAGP